MTKLNEKVMRNTTKNETRKNTITSTKQAIKEMILQDSEIIKILND